MIKLVPNLIFCILLISYNLTNAEQNSLIPKIVQDYLDKYDRIAIVDSENITIKNREFKPLYILSKTSRNRFQKKYDIDPYGSIVQHFDANGFKRTTGCSDHNGQLIYREVMNWVRGDEEIHIIFYAINEHPSVGWFFTIYFFDIDVCSSIQSQDDIVPTLQAENKNDQVGSKELSSEEFLNKLVISLQKDDFESANNLIRDHPITAVQVQVWLTLASFDEKEENAEEHQAIAELIAKLRKRFPLSTKQSSEIIDPNTFLDEFHVALSSGGGDNDKINRLIRDLIKDPNAITIVYREIVNKVKEGGINKNFYLTLQEL